MFVSKMTVTIERQMHTQVQTTAFVVEWIMLVNTCMTSEPLSLFTTNASNYEAQQHRLIIVTEFLQWYEFYDKGVVTSWLRRWVRRTA
jgi:hypothetical protein